MHPSGTKTLDHPNTHTTYDKYHTMANSTTQSVNTNATKLNPNRTPSRTASHQVTSPIYNESLSLFYEVWFFRKTRLSLYSKTRTCFSRLQFTFQIFYTYSNFSFFNKKNFIFKQTSLCIIEKMSIQIWYIFYFLF